MTLRAILIVCGVFAGAYWFDQTFYAGSYSHSAAQMFGRIVQGFR
jgi:hypothetical protein